MSSAFASHRCAADPPPSASLTQSYCAQTSKNIPQSTRKRMCVVSTILFLSVTSAVSHPQLKQRSSHQRGAGASSLARAITAMPLEFTSPEAQPSARGGPLTWKAERSGGQRTGAQQIHSRHCVPLTSGSRIQSSAAHIHICSARFFAIRCVL